MRRYFILPVMLATLALAGCAGGIVSTVTSSITNPVNQVDIYRAKNVYAATLELAVGYRNYCWARSYAALMADPIARPVCRGRRAVVRTMQSADTRAFAALDAADKFVRNNPTLNAASLIGAAWTAVTALATVET